MKRAIISRSVELGEGHARRDTPDLSNPKTFFLHVLLFVVSLVLGVPLVFGILHLMFAK